MEKKKRGIEHKRLIVVANNYHYCLKRIAQIKKSKIISQSEQEILNSYTEYIQRINSTLSEFDLLEQSILDREYFSPFPKGWWMDIYPRSTFYRIRLETSRRFLELLQ